MLTGLCTIDALTVWQLICKVPLERRLGKNCQVKMYHLDRLQLKKTHCHKKIISFSLGVYKLMQPHLFFTFLVFFSLLSIIKDGKGFKTKYFGVTLLNHKKLHFIRLFKSTEFQALLHTELLIDTFRDGLAWHMTHQIYNNKNINILSKCIEQKSLFMHTMCRYVWPISFCPKYMGHSFADEAPATYSHYNYAILYCTTLYYFNTIHLTGKMGAEEKQADMGISISTVE